MKNPRESIRLSAALQRCIRRYFSAILIAPYAYASFQSVVIDESMHIIERVCFIVWKPIMKNISVFVS